MGRQFLQVVLVPIPSQGHITPILQLATILHLRGFSITVCHPEFHPINTSSFPHFNFRPLKHGSGDDDDDNGSSFSWVDILISLNVKYKASLMDSLTQIVGTSRQHPVTCVIYDGWMYVAAEVANHLNLPSIAFHTCNANNLVNYLLTPRLVQDGHIPIQGSKLLEQVPGLSPFRFKDLSIPSTENLDVLLKSSTFFCNVKTTSAIIINTNEFLEQPSLEMLKKQFQIPIFPIGPVHKVSPTICSSLLEEDVSCFSWLDKQAPNSVLYVSFGSVVFLSKEEFTELAWGLANSKQPFLWVIPPNSLGGLRSLEALPDGFKDVIGERGCVVTWVPQKEVLTHDAIGGFFSHCGWNSTMESISAGIPIICSAHFGDQHLNARYLSHVWRIGIELEKGFCKEEVENAIRRLMSDAEGKEMRKRAMDLREMVEISVHSGGSSSNNLNELINFIMSF